MFAGGEFPRKRLDGQQNIRQLPVTDGIIARQHEIIERSATVKRWNRRVFLETPGAFAKNAIAAFGARYIGALYNFPAAAAAVRAGSIRGHDALLSRGSHRGAPSF